MSEVAKHIDGVPLANGLLQTIRPMHETFRINIRSTAPIFRPFEKKHDGIQHMARAPFLVAEEGVVWEGEESDYEEDTFSNADIFVQKRLTRTRKIFIEEVVKRADE